MNALLWTAEFTDSNEGVWYTQVAIFRSEDRSTIWSRVLNFYKQSPEGSMVRLPSSELSAVERYQRPKWQEDPEKIIEHTQGGATRVRIIYHYKNLFLLNSDDGSRAEPTSKDCRWPSFRLTPANTRPKLLPCKLLPCKF